MHLIEIDLLRGGERPPLLDPVPPAPYYITLSHAERRRGDCLAGEYNVFTVPAPLLIPIGRASDLGAAIAAVYKRGAYAVRIDYSNRRHRRRCRRKSKRGLR